MVRHVQVTVFNDQVRIAARFDLALLVKQDVLTGSAKDGIEHSVCRIYGHIPRFGPGLAVNLDLSVLGGQGHVLFSIYGINVLAVAADGDVAAPRHDLYIAAVGLHGLHHFNVAIVGRQLHVAVSCFYIAIAVGPANNDGSVIAACAHGQLHILPGGNVFSYSDRTVGDLGLHAAVDINIMRKFNVALVIHLDDQVPFGHGVVRYLDAAVIGMQGQVAAREQLAVLRDDNVLCIVLVQRHYGDIAFLGPRGAVHSDGAALHGQIHILLRVNRVFVFIVADIDLAIFCPYSHAAVRRHDGSLHRYVTLLLDVDGYVLFGLDIAGAVFLAHRYVAGLRGHGYRTLVSRDGLAYGDVAGISLHGHVFRNGNVFAQFNVAPVAGPGVEAVFRTHVVRDAQVAVFYGQVRIVSSRNLAILGKYNALVCIIGIVYNRYVHIAGLRGRLAVDFNLAVVALQVHVLFGPQGILVLVVADFDVASLRQDIHAAVIRPYGLHHVHIAIVHRHAHILAGLYVGAYGNVALLHGHVHILARFHAGAYRNIAFHVGGHGYTAVLGINRFTYGNVARVGGHVQVIVYGNVITQRNIAAFNRLRIQVPACGHTARYNQVASGHDQVGVAARCNLAVLVKDNAFSAFHIGIVGCMYGNIAGFRSSLAVDPDLSAVGDQAHILFGPHGIIVFVAADLDIAFRYMYVYAAGLRLHGLVYGNVAGTYGHIHIVIGNYAALSVLAYLDVAGLHVHIHIVARVHIRAYGNVARVDVHIHIYAGGYVFAYVDVARIGSGHGDRTVIGSDGLAYVNVTLLGLHGHVLVYGDVGSHTDIALTPCLHVQAPACCHIIRYKQVTVGHDQVGVAARHQFTVLGKDDVPAVFTRHIVVVGGMYGNIAGLRGGLAFNLNLTALSGQFHVLVGRYRIHIRAVTADLDVALLYLHVHAAAGGFHGLVHGHVAGGYLQRHIVTRSHVTLTVAAAYLDVARGGSHIHILACVDVFADGDVADIGGGGHVAGHVHVLFKGYVAFIIDRYGHVPFG